VMSSDIGPVAALSSKETEPKTFDGLFSEHNLTPRERELLVWHLAEMRARKTVQSLLKLGMTDG